jgi:hypothetical protein
MKRICILFFVSSFLMSCQDSNKTEVDSGAEKNQEIYDRNVASFRAFVKGFTDENLDAQMALFADSAMWSPPQYNGNEWVDKTAFKEAILGYHQNFDDITFEEGIDLGMGGDRQPAFWSGSVWPTGNATSVPNNIRIYGTWRAVHTESGKVVFNKWYGLMFFNEEGKIVRFTDWFDVNGMQVQINAE